MLKNFSKFYYAAPDSNGDKKLLLYSIVGFAMVVVLFIMDIFIPRGYGFAFFYLFPLLIIQQAHRKVLYPVSLSILAFALTAGAVLKPLFGLPVGVMIVNRINSFIILFIVTILNYLRQVYLAELRDARIVAEKNAEKMRYICIHDSLTGLYNRAFFEEELARLDSESELPISIIMSDANNLKITNDIFGHHEGDKLLKRIANILCAAFRKNDIIVRWGGDEFTAIMPKTSFATAVDLVHRIERECGKVNDMLFQPSISLGVAVKDNKEKNIYEVLHEAEERMYRNKSDEAQKNFQKMIEGICRHLLIKKPELKEHINRLKRMIQELAAVLLLSNKQINSLKEVAELHDIGKIMIPQKIWLKNGRFLSHEWTEMKKNREASYRIARLNIKYAEIADVLLSINEHWDGTGYPHSLKHNDIPYLSRVFAVIDAFDAMTHLRSYAPVMDFEEAVSELQREAGKQFDPKIVESFVNNITFKR